MDSLHTRMVDFDGPYSLSASAALIAVPVSGPGPQRGGEQMISRALGGRQLVRSVSSTALAMAAQGGHN